MKTPLKPIVEIKQRSRIYMGAAKEHLEELLAPYGRVVVVSDRTVAELYAPLFGSYPTCLISQGEEHKSLQSVERLYKELLTLGADRHTFILAIGGGIVCDVAGFVASTYMRGLHFGSLPTTLLAQVDASVGGKNGVNFGGVKNIVGCFSQPDFVLCDPSLTLTLPRREFACGLAEVIKMAILGDRELFEQLEACDMAGLRAQPKLLGEVVERAILGKAEIVERDEREAGERRKLNLGHTFAHAIEACDGSYKHGEAVAVGVVMAADMAVKRGVLGEVDRERIMSLIKRYELPVDVDISIDHLKQYMAKDKKSCSDKIAWILPTAIGACEILPLRLEEAF